MLDFWGLRVNVKIHSVQELAKKLYCAQRRSFRDPASVPKWRDLSDKVKVKWFKFARRCKA